MPKARLARILVGIVFLIIALDQALLALHYTFGGVPYIKFSSTTVRTQWNFVSCTIGAIACLLAARGIFLGAPRESKPDDDDDANATGFDVVRRATEGR